jgi:flagellar FliJ protein
MQRFQFRLETLLKIRKMHKEQAQIHFSQAVERLHLEQEQLTVFENKLFEAINSFRSRQKAERLMIDTLISFQYYFDKTKEEINGQQQKIRLADQYRQECLATLKEAVKHCKLVEKLREKRLQQYQLEVLVAEQKILDEIGTQRYARGK